MKEKFAVIKIGGSQHIVSEGDSIDINRIPGKAGDRVEITDVLLVSEGKTVDVGNPTVGYVVKAEISKQYRGDKVETRIFKAKPRYRKKRGHRQPMTQLKIKKISKKTAKPSTSKTSTSRRKTAK
jgi:large subunit ribosomal protein L21